MTEQPTGLSRVWSRNEVNTLEARAQKTRSLLIKALSLGRAFSVCGALLTATGWSSVANADTRTTTNGEMTAEEAIQLGEDFGIAVGEVDEEIRKELKLQRAEGVAVFEVIGNSRADYAGIKVRSVIKEIDKKKSAPSSISGKPSRPRSKNVISRSEPTSRQILAIRSGGA